jgi:hypothetical protein
MRMSDDVAAVITAAGARVTVGPRTSAIIEELVARQDRIEGIGKGSIEVRADFTGGSVTVSLKEVGSSRRIDAR